MPDDEQLLQSQWGERLRARRLALGLSQYDLAPAAEISVPYLSLLERGVNNPGNGVRMRLAAALGTTVEDLFPYPPAEPERAAS